VFFCTDDGFGIEMVQALDEAHIVTSPLLVSRELQMGWR
jgi:hypothetical protein